ncbi:YaaC family protein [Actinoplanes sp. CA-030573]|uniref:YaaC family protein n=1 Tax=Actinoplanes sp. CA-030573 TaxID=3239898 RepID=UPI003D921FEA
MPQDPWRKIRALRAEPVEQASEESRIANYQGALAQAEELAEAARAAGYASNALPLFYAVEQCGRAILEARWPGQIHKLKGHGLSFGLARDPDHPNDLTKKDPNILRSLVAPRGNGSFQAVCEAIGSKPLAGPVALGALWMANPDLRGAWIPDAVNEWQPPITYGVGARETARDEYGKQQDPESAWATTEGFVYIPVEMPGETVKDVREILQRYPTLGDAGVVVEGPAGHIIGTDDDTPVLRRYTYGGLKYVSVAKPVPREMTMADFWAAQDSMFSLVEVDDKAKSERGVPHWIGHALPRLGGGISPDPLMLWWAFLHGLSNLVRYHPGSWTAAINADSSIIADSLQRALDIAMEKLPERLVAAIVGDQGHRGRQ